jgi:hypothetical protein
MVRPGCGGRVRSQLLRIRADPLPLGGKARAASGDVRLAGATQDARDSVAQAVAGRRVAVLRKGSAGSDERDDGASPFCGRCRPYREMTVTYFQTREPRKLAFSVIGERFDRSGEQQDSVLKNHSFPPGRLAGRLAN